MTKRDYKKLSEQAATVAAVLYPLSAVPQAVKIFTHKDAASLSLTAWIGFTLIELIFFVYGVTHNLRPLVLTGVLWMVLYALIITGIIIYG